MSIHDKKIIFERADGSLIVRTPVALKREGETDTQYYDRIAAKNKPVGSTQKSIISATSLPYADPADNIVIEDYVLDESTQVVSKQPVVDKIQAFRDSWRWDGATGKVVVDAALEVEERWSRIRTIRNKLLELSDSSMARENEQGGPNQNAYKAYRQSLRDLPADNSDPSDVTWPGAP